MGEKEKGGKEKERKGKKEEGKWTEKLYFLFKIYGDRVVGFHRSKRQSSSTRRELHVGTRILGFRQTPRGRGFSHTLVILGLRAFNGIGFFGAVSGRTVQSQNYGTESWNV